MENRKEKVVVAMSGGVDSSVAACLLVEQGYDVIGLFMRVGASELPRAADFSPRGDVLAEDMQIGAATVREQDGKQEKNPLPHGRGSDGDDASRVSDAQHADDAARKSVPPYQGGATGGSTAPATSPNPSLVRRGAASVTGSCPPTSRTDQCTTSETSRRLKPAARVHQGCCSASDAADARFVAGMLNVPFYALNFQADFDKIIDYFADEYVNGRTPNPCVICNDKLKFGRLVDYADAIGAKYIATGHYARVGSYDARDLDPLDSRHRSTSAQSRNVLMRGRDEQKDQSYVLFGLEREILDRVLFPVGELTKNEVRAMAERFNLPNRNKPDSVDICFVPDRDYARVVKERRPEAFVEGAVLDCEGATIGRHQGVANYTVGQRRGLGIAAGKPIYVTQLNVADNTVTMGPDEDLLQSSLIAGRANFLIDPPDGPFRADVKIRYLHKAAPARIEVLRGNADSCAPRAEGFSPRERSDGNEAARETVPPYQGGITGGLDAAETSPNPSLARRGARPLPHGRGSERFGRNPKNTRVAEAPLLVRVVFDKPQRAITPGQAVVFYDGDVVLGGAWIERAVSAACSSYYPKKEALI